MAAMEVEGLPLKRSSEAAPSNQVKPRWASLS